MTQSPYEIFIEECPEVAERFNDLIKAQQSLEGLDAKTKQLINIAIQTANRNVKGVHMHAMMAKNEGATREEVVGAVVLNYTIPDLHQCLTAFQLLSTDMKANF